MRWSIALIVLAAPLLRASDASPPQQPTPPQKPQMPRALLINLPKHTKRFEAVSAEMEAAQVRYERAEAVDGKAMPPAEYKEKVTFMARQLMTPGMVGCFLSHQNCWRRCAEEANGPLLVFEDDVMLTENFAEQLSTAMAELPDDWDVLLLGALGAVHPSYYAVNVGHAMLAGGLRVPRGAKEAFSDKSPKMLHTPLRPFGTHAYAISERGARKLLRRLPRANYHVDVAAWGVRSLKLYAVHPILAKQTHGDTTIGGKADRSWLPNFVIDKYTGTDFAWAWNAPLMKLLQAGGKGGFLVTSGRATFSTLSLLGIAALLYHLKSPHARLVLLAGLGWPGLLYFLLCLLTWPQVADERWRAPAAEPASA